MKPTIICAFICVLLLPISRSAAAVLPSPDDSVTGSHKVIVYETKVDAPPQQKGLVGFAVGVDLCGAVMRAVSSWGQLEVLVRANIGNTWFPIAEAGWGLCDKKHDDTNLHYKVSSPYLRLGCDYNFLHNNSDGNRIFGGLRYAFSPYKFDLSGPDLNDAVWHTTVPFQYTSVSGSAHWLELVAGLEAAVWNRLHIGWTVRYKTRLYEKKTTVGNSWYIPGYGESDSSTLGASFNIVLDF